MIASALLDWDGTLVDSMPFWYAVPQRYCREKGVAYFPQLGEVIGSMTMAQAAVAATDMLHLDQTPAQTLEEMKQMVRRAYGEEIPLKPGVLDTVRAFHAAGVRLGIASASDTELIRTTLPRLGLAPYIDAVCTCTDTGDGRNKEESPAVYEECLRRLGGSDRTQAVIFDDALFAARTALAAGFRVAGVFESTAPDDQAELQRICTYYFRNATKWRTLL